jgi:hypothetical protein
VNLSLGNGRKNGVIKSKSTFLINNLRPKTTLAKTMLLNLIAAKSH